MGFERVQEEGMTPIPVLGVLCLNRGDLLTRMVESIDYPVQQLVIVLNGVDESVAAAANRIRELYPSVVVYNPGYDQPRPVNLGFAGGWNWILRNFMSEYVMVIGNDVQLFPGQLQRIADYWDRHKNDDPPMAVLNTNFGWNIHSITRHGLNVMGFLDENFYPCYYDDCDMDYRHTLARRKKLVSYPVEGECTIQAHHEVSATSRALPPEKAERMAKAFERNVEYYVRKWGGPQCHELFEYPFNNPALSIRDWTLEPGRWKLNSLG